MGLSLRIRTPLSHFDLDVAEEFGDGVTALVGPSGAGKTSILETIAGLRRPASGRLVGNGRLWLDTASGVACAPRERRVGYVFQDLALFPNLSAGQNVAWGIGGSRTQRREEAAELLRQFGLDGDMDRPVTVLSGGERRRVALARTLATMPTTLLLDEPLTGLDARSRGDAVAALRIAISRVDGPTVLVTHNFADAADLAEEVLVLEEGRIAQRGTAASIGAAPASRFVASLVGANALEGRATPRGGGLTEVYLTGGSRVLSTDDAVGPVVATVFPLDIALAPAPAPGSALNAIGATVRSLSAIGPHTRVRLSIPEELIAEITTVSAERLGLAPGQTVRAIWKATATRLVSR